MMANAVPVKFFTLPGCPLCEKARKLFREFEQTYPLEVEEINILRDERYYEQYKHTIPVVIIAGQPPLESIITREELRGQLHEILYHR